MTRRNGEAGALMGAAALTLSSLYISIKSVKFVK
jgi:hypothetical protein